MDDENPMLLMRYIKKTEDKNEILNLDFQVCVLLVLRNNVWRK